jgi:hypothetical protein
VNPIVWTMEKFGKEGITVKEGRIDDTQSGSDPDIVASDQLPTSITFTSASCSITTRADWEIECFAREL